ncbi:Enamine deaminase RidA, house cleaning of reactive enamine intermediates, YjgF/YER057c/UK114 family [Aquimarina amphilecti]|uniref:Enamine deaminase RidA, house cleaning of reactive enamine intermediates, YjgF/YER057c/UK114 family n=1 Tax=Aquimarina amphilecti TaxID=1038014 RepID=A0A1H7GMD9_AQUAM|nr:RidA family protein [Aquimarina amphilecti]SEK39313.1 Enamine deaminase RidA, house cleaning of reactive enamine intermediates, YjgF/YER057c/UK114 family [Aquimarina amphilecti]
MQEIKKIATGSPWEDIVGYSRAIKIGNIIEISGTTAPGRNEYEQTVAIIENIKKVLEGLDASLDNVIRTRIYCTDITQWEKIGKAHGEYFGKIKPVTSMVEVSKLIDPSILVEIEFSAIVSQ